MAPTIVGTDEVTALSRHIILPYITDQVYGSNALLYRLVAANRRVHQGGTHIEVPFMYQKPTNGGAYDGAYEVVDVSPWETTLNMAFDMRYYEVPITIDEKTLDRMNTDLAVVNELTYKAETAKMHLADILGTDLSQSEGSSGTGSDLKKLTGLKAVIDDTTNTTNYGQLARATYSGLNATLDAATATLTLASLQSLVSSATKGGHAPTILRSRRMQYDRYIALLQAMQRIYVGNMAKDENLAQAGFTNVLYGNIPWIVDDKTMDGANTSNSRIEAINETVLELHCYGSGEFSMTEWLRPVDQPGAMTSFVKWKGEIISPNPQLHAAMTAVTA